MRPAQPPASISVHRDAGEARIVLPLRPVSAQARGEVKREFKKALQDLVASQDTILLNDVTIDVKWHVHEQLRYESDEAPDVDNILKPLLDAISGQNGLLINDCQVQAITSFWVDGYYDLQFLEISFRFEPDFAVDRSSIVFVRFFEQLYFPMDESLNPRVLLSVVDIHEAQYKARAELLDIGNSYSTARLVMPCQRVYHRTRIEGFRRYEKDEYRALLRSRLS